MTSKAKAAIAFGVVVLVILFTVIWHVHHHHHTDKGSANTTQVVYVNPNSTASAPTPSSSTTTDGPVPTSTSNHSPLSGDALDKAFLQGYLSRTSMDNNDWIEAIAPYSDPAVAPALSNPPNQIDISWNGVKVNSITKDKPLPGQHVSTPSRTINHWTVILSDPNNPKNTTVRGYTITDYLGDNNTWWVTQVAQDYLGGH